MISKDFEHALSRISRKPLPECPKDLLQNITRKIRQRKRGHSIGTIEWIYSQLFEFGWAVPTIALTIGLTAVTARVAFDLTKDQSAEAASNLQMNSITDSQQLNLFKPNH